MGLILPEYTSHSCRPPWLPPGYSYPQHSFQLSASQGTVFSTQSRVETHPGQGSDLLGAFPPAWEQNLACGLPWWSSG